MEASTTPFRTLRTVLSHRAHGPALIAAWQELFEDLAQGKITIAQSVLTNLSRATGLSQRHLQEGLRCQFSGWARCERDPGSWQWPAPLSSNVAVVAAGNVPGVAVPAAVLLSAAGLPVVVKQASADRWLLPWLIEVFEERHPDWAAGIVAQYWPAGSPELEQVLQSADRVIAFGSRETLQELRQRYEERLLAFGPKFSVAIVTADGISPNCVGALARDVALYQQRGCLSVQAVFVIGTTQVATAFADDLADALECTVTRLGYAEEITADRMRKHALCNTLALLGHRYWANDDLRWLVMLVPEFSAERLVGNNTVQVIPVASLQQALGFLQPYRAYVQGCALCGMAIESVEDRLRTAGFSYVASAGAMQSPPLDWANEGIRLPDAFAHPDTHPGSY